MKRLILIAISILILLFNVNPCVANQNNANSTRCDCTMFNYIKPSTNLLVDILPNRTLIICSYEKAEAKKYAIKLDEFEIFDCKEGKVVFKSEPLNHYRINLTKLEITTLKDLPDINLGFTLQPFLSRKLYIKFNHLKFSDKFLYNYPKLSINEQNILLKEIAAQRKSLRTDNINRILIQLFFLALNGNQKATDILIDFENYFSWELDGESAEIHAEFLDVINCPARLSTEMKNKNDKFK